MTEFELIDQIFRQTQAEVLRATPDSRVIYGIGDDAAVLTLPPEQQLVICTDTLVQGRHFSADWSDIEQLAFAIGYKAAAVNVSDLAAMSATPQSILLALALPERLANTDWLTGFAKGLFHACQQFGVTLIGGDTTRHDSLVITVTAQGYVDQRLGVVTRSGASVGDKLYVSGTLGDASYALKHGDSDIGKELAHRLHMPTPRVRLGQALGKPPHRATAMIDISDGLYQDLSHLCRASGVGIRLNLEQLPSSNAMQSAALQSHLFHQLTGGDDYELAFTLPKGVQPPQLDTAITCIGEVVAVTGSQSDTAYLPQLFYQGQVVSAEQPFPFDYLPKLQGYQHFG